MIGQQPWDRIRVHFNKLVCPDQLVYLNGHLRHENELITLEQASACVHEDEERDKVHEVCNSSRQILGGICFCDGILKHHTKCLKHRKANLFSV